MFYIHIHLKVEDCEAERFILFSGKYCIFLSLYLLTAL